MTSNRVRVSQLIDSPLRLTWQESVALVRSIAAVRGASASVPSSGTFDEFVVDENGEVTAVGSGAPLSVSELALLLARLLPASPRTADTDASAQQPERPPAALYFTIARALALVDAPSFASIQDFSAALARFERARPAVALRQVIRRHAASPQGAPTPDTRGELGTATKAVVRMELFAASESAGESSQPTRSTSVTAPDRRKTRMPSDVLRRMLREEDRRNFLDMQSRSALAGSKRPRQTGPDPQMLRRFIREADERTYVLMQENAARVQSLGRPRSRRTGYHAAFALLALLVAVGVLAFIGWQRSVPKAVTMPAGSRAAAPQVAAVNAAPVKVEVAKPTPPVATATNGTTAQAEAFEEEDAEVAPAAQAQTSKQATRAATPPVSRKPAAKTTSVSAVNGVGDRAVVKKRGPVPRFFGAIYRRLGNLVRRDSGQATMTQ